MNTIEFKHCKIRELLRDFYIIPDYQREYVWKEKNVKELLDDISAEFCNKTTVEYFLGTIIVCKNVSSKKLEVIDGQQRLITLSLILAVIKEIYRAHNEDLKAIDILLYTSDINEYGNTINSFILDLEYNGKDILYKILKEESVCDKDILGLPSSTINDAYETIRFYFQENFKIDTNLDILKKFVGYFLNFIKVIRIETNDLGSALKIFETINERGVSLDQVDLLKNLIFRQISRKDFNRLKLEWNRFKKEIQGNKVNEKPLRFIRYFIISNYEVSNIGDSEQNGEIIREDQIYQWFVENETKCNIKNDPFKFTQILYESAKFYIGLMKDEFYGHSNLYLKNIRYLVGNGYKQHYILLLAAKNMDEKVFSRFAAHLEVLLFYYAITKEIARDIERKFVRWASEIQRIDSYKKLDAFINNNFKPEIDNRQIEYKQQFTNLKYTNIQKFKLKYILAKLSEYVDRKRIGNADTFDLDMYLNKNINIEHILPDTPTKDIVFNFNGGNQKEYNLYKMKIGNLTLLEQPINKSIKRGEYDYKKARYIDSMFYLTKSISKLDNGGKSTSIARINAELTEFIDWNKKTIDNRTEMLFILSKKVWDIEKF